MMFSFTWLSFRAQRELDHINHKMQQPFWLHGKENVDIEKKNERKAKQPNNSR